MAPEPIIKRFRAPKLIHLGWPYPLSERGSTTTCLRNETLPLLLGTVYRGAPSVYRGSDQRSYQCADPAGHTNDCWFQISEITPALCGDTFSNPTALGPIPTLA